MDKSTGDSVPFFAGDAPPFLTDLIPDDAKKPGKGGRQNWDTRKAVTNQVGGILDTGGLRHQKLAARVQDCANILNFGWVQSSDAGVHELRLKWAQFCRVRTCPICQWRRSQMLLSRFFEAFPRIRADYPTTRYAFLTLTVRNCPVSELRATVQHMGVAWSNLTKRKAFPAIGFVRSLEVTKETDIYDKTTKKLIHKARPDYAHPHFHILLALPPSYFGGNYLSTAKWAALWQAALKTDYTPVCDVRMVKARKTDGDGSGGDMDGIRAAIVETIKYTVKPSDMVQDASFLLELVDQLHKIRAVSLGGIFKDYLQDVGGDDGGVDADGQDGPENLGGIRFGWRNPVKRYQLNP
jgi:plasmid rolling circle replication initiator protein Rep